MTRYKIPIPLHHTFVIAALFSVLKALTAIDFTI